MNLAPGNGQASASPPSVWGCGLPGCLRHSCSGGEADEPPCGPGGVRPRESGQTDAALAPQGDGLAHPARKASPPDPITRHPTPAQQGGRARGLERGSWLSYTTDLHEMQAVRHLCGAPFFVGSSSKGSCAQGPGAQPVRHGDRTELARLLLRCGIPGAGYLPRQPPPRLPGSGGEPDVGRQRQLDGPVDVDPAARQLLRQLHGHLAVRHPEDGVGNPDGQSAAAVHGAAQLPVGVLTKKRPRPGCRNEAGRSKDEKSLAPSAFCWYSGLASQAASHRPPVAELGAGANRRQATGGMPMIILYFAHYQLLVIVPLVSRRNNREVGHRAR